MSKVHDVEPLELHILSRAGEPNPRYAEILTVVAHYHRTAAHLGLGHSLNLGEPLVAGSTCTHGVLSLPYLDGPRLEWMQSPRVRFLWLLPVTEQEVAYKQQHGLEALERRFEESGFDYLDPCRGSVVWGDARIPMDPEPC